jgi:hypothetical protein
VSILSDPQRRTSPGNRVKWLGSGLYVCGVCDQPALRVSRTGNHRQPAYRCKARDNTGQGGGHVTRAAPPLDDYVERIIVARLQQPDATDLFTTPTDPELDTTALHTEAAAISQRLTDLSAAFAEGAITVAQLRTGTSKLRARLSEIDDILTVTVLPTGKGRRPDGSYFDPPESTSNGRHTDHRSCNQPPRDTPPKPTLTLHDPHRTRPQINPGESVDTRRKTRPERSAGLTVRSWTARRVGDLMGVGAAN